MFAVGSIALLASVASAEDLGEEGQIVISNDVTFGAVGPSSASAQIDHHFHHGHGGDGGKGTVFSLQPAFDYFIAGPLSVGGAIVLDNFGEKLGVGLGGRVGYALPVGPLVFWPKAGIQLYHKSDWDVLTFDVVAPFAYSPAEHFFIGLGPKLSVQLTEGSNTNLGIVSSIGGYF